MTYSLIVNLSRCPPSSSKTLKPPEVLKTGGNQITIGELQYPGSELSGSCLYTLPDRYLPPTAAPRCPGDASHTSDGILTRGGRGLLPLRLIETLR